MNKFIVIFNDCEVYDITEVYGFWDTAKEAYAFCKKQAKDIQMKLDAHPEIHEYKNRNAVELEDWGNWIVSTPTIVNS